MTMESIAAPKEGSSLDIASELQRIERQNRRDNFGRAWYKFSQNPLSVIGLGMVTLVILLAIFAPIVAPYPHHVKPFVDFANAKSPPTAQNIMGTDQHGRDIFSRVLFGFRFSLLMGVVVLTLVVPTGVVLGMVAGFFQGTLIASDLPKSKRA